MNWYLIKVESLYVQSALNVSSVELNIIQSGINPEDAFLKLKEARGLEGYTTSLKDIKLIEEGNDNG